MTDIDGPVDEGTPPSAPPPPQEAKSEQAQAPDIDAGDNTKIKNSFNNTNNNDQRTTNNKEKNRYSHNRNSNNTSNSNNNNKTENAYHFYAGNLKWDREKTADEQGEPSRPETSRISETRLDPETATIAQRAYRTYQDAWSNLWKKHGWMAIAAESHDVALAITGMLVEKVFGLPTVVYDSEITILDTTGLTRLIEEAARLANGRNTSLAAPGKRWLLFLRANVDAAGLPHWDSSVRNAIGVALEKASGSLILSLRLQGSPTGRREEVVAANGLPLSYFVAQSLPGEQEPAGLVEDIIESLPAIRRELILRDADLLKRSIEKHAAICDRQSFIQAVVRELREAVAAMSQGSALLDEEDPARRAVIHAVGFIACYFPGLELPAFLRTARDILQALDTSRPIRKAVPPPFEAPAGTKPEIVLCRRIETFEDFSDTALRSVGLVIGEKGGIDFRDQLHRQRVLDEFQANPVTEMECLSALLGADIWAASASPVWRDQFAALIVGIAGRWPAEFERFLAGPLAPPLTGANRSFALPLYEAVIRGLAARDGGGNHIDAIRLHLLAKESAHAAFTLDLARRLVSDDIIDGMEWLKALVTRHSGDTRLLNSVERHLLTRIAWDIAGPKDVIGALLDWINDDGPAYRAQARHFAVRFLQNYVNYSLSYWEVGSHQLLAYPLLRLADGDEDDRSRLSGVVRVWRREDGDEPGFKIDGGAGWVEYNVAVILGYLAGAMQSTERERVRSAIRSLAAAVKEVYPCRTNSDLASKRAFDRRLDAMRPLIEYDLLSRPSLWRKSGQDAPLIISTRVKECFAQFLRAS